MQCAARIRIRTRSSPLWWQASGGRGIAVGQGRQPGRARMPTSDHAATEGDGPPYRGHGRRSRHCLRGRVPRPVVERSIFTSSEGFSRLGKTPHPPSGQGQGVAARAVACAAHPGRSVFRSGGFPDGCPVCGGSRPGGFGWAVLALVGEAEPSCQDAALHSGIARPSGNPGAGSLVVVWAAPAAGTHP